VQNYKSISQKTAII